MLTKLTLGEKLKDLRLVKGYKSTKHLSSVLKIPKTTLNDYENNVKNQDVGSARTLPHLPCQRPSILLNRLEVLSLGNYKIQEVFGLFYDKYCDGNHFQSDIQRKAARAILTCKSGALGCNISRCDDCGHTEIHNNTCRNRNCLNCQAVQKEVWIDQRKSEVMD